MKVSQGWSGETAHNRWAKINVELDEGDLTRLLLSVHLTDVDPARIPVDVAFHLLEVEAEYLITSKLINQYGYPADAGEQRLAVLRQSKDDILVTARKWIQIYE